MKHTLICIEGTDGCGKKTQSELLHKALTAQGKNVIVVSFPNYESISSGPVKMYLGGEFGDKANCFDAYQASSLYAVDRLCTMKKIMNELKQDTVIIFDRYVQSNMMFQATKLDRNKDINKCLDWIDNFEFNVLKLPRPDKVLFLDVPPKISYAITNKRADQKTGNKIDIHENDLAFMTNVYNKTKHAVKRFKWTTINCTDGDTLKSIEEIHQMILAEVK